MANTLENGGVGGEAVPENFEDTLDNLIFQKKKIPQQYLSTLNEIREMAEGGTADGIREEYYAEWSDNHFKKLLEGLGEK